MTQYPAKGGPASLPAETISTPPPAIGPEVQALVRTLAEALAADGNRFPPPDDAARPAGGETVSGALALSRILAIAAARIGMPAAAPVEAASVRFADSSGGPATDGGLSPRDGGSREAIPPAPPAASAGPAILLGPADAEPPAPAPEGAASVLALLRMLLEAATAADGDATRLTNEAAIDGLARRLLGAAEGAEAGRRTALMALRDLVWRVDTARVLIEPKLDAAGCADLAELLSTEDIHDLLRDTP